MALVGYSKETGHIITPQNFDPSDRNIDAERLKPADLLRLFEPNEGDGDHGICSYDRLANAAGPYYLVAERGVGKTHTLGLLGLILGMRGDTVLKIELTENRILSSYEKLRNDNHDEQRAALWQVAILEEASLALADRYLRYIEEAEFHALPPLLRKRFEQEFRKSLVDFYGYLKKYRKEDWAKYHRIEHKLQKSSVTIADLLGRVISKIQIIIPPVKLGVLPMGEPASTPVPASQQLEKKEEEGTVLSARMLALEDWFWNVLGWMRQLRHRPMPEINSRLARQLPKSHSIYVLADGLDQTLKPMSHDDLLALKHATRFLNRKATKKLKPGEEQNFKVILSFRAVTYYYITRNDRDTEQEYSDVEPLKWDSSALMHMMARRIRETDDLLPGNLTTIEILQTRFPREIHYFSHVFSPTPMFLFRFAGFRPRQVILLWQSCALRAGLRDHPYNAVLSEDQIIDGFKEYSLGILPEDINQEYVTEYPVLTDLLNYFATQLERIERQIPIIRLRTTIEGFLQEYRKRNQVKMPPWMENGADEIIDTLYRIGIIGIPVDRLDTDWPDVRHVHRDRTDRFLKASQSHTLTILPPMWNFLTNIQEETHQRRVYIRSLYLELRKSTAAVKDFLDMRDGRIRSMFELELFRFLALGKVIREYVRYPEPVDWRIWQDVCRAILHSWEALHELTSWNTKEKEWAVSRIDTIAAKLSPYVLEARDVPSSKLSFRSLEEFERQSASREYGAIIAPLASWLASYAGANQLSPATQAFYLSLFKGSQSLITALDAADETIKTLI